VPNDWRDAILVPIPKKCLSLWLLERSLFIESSWKVVARGIQERLQNLAEDVSPESQCGFRKGRSCTDMIFVVGNWWRRH